jgi:hypothetical protein
MIFDTNLHTIDQFRLDVSYFEVESAREAQKQISILAAEELSRVYEKLCAEFGQDTLFKLQKLTIDLGDISLESLNVELIKRFENQLRSILQALKRGEYSMDGVSGIEVQELDDVLIKGFIHFINTGTLPFYVQKLLGSRSVKEILNQINEYKIPVFQKELRSSATTMMAFGRIVRLFPGSELLQFFHFVFPETKSQTFNQIYDNVKNLFNSHPDNDVKFQLLDAGREFLVSHVLSSGIDDRRHVLKELLIFLENEKNVLPEKWIPEVVFSMKKQQTNLVDNDSGVRELISELYFNYLLGHKPNEIREFHADGLQKNSHEMEIKKESKRKQSYVNEQLIEFVKQLADQVKQYYTSVEEERIETVINGIADEIVPKNTLSSDTLKYWAEAISSEVKRLFGVAIEASFKEKVSDSDLIVQMKHSKVTDNPQKSVSNSVALAYWVMFLSSGITPFEKLYAKPKHKLIPIFTKLLEKDKDAALWQLQQSVNESNVMVIAWWFKESMNDALFDFFRTHIQYSLSVRLDEELTYSSVMTSALFSTGNFPWPELNNHGHAELVQLVSDFVLESDEFSLSQFAFQNNLFGNLDRMKKVFEMLPVQTSKKLLQVRINLQAQGKIQNTPKNNEDYRIISENNLNTEKNNHELQVDIQEFVHGERDGELDPEDRISNPDQKKSKNSNNEFLDSSKSDLDHFEITSKESESLTSSLEKFESSEFNRKPEGINSNNFKGKDIQQAKDRNFEENAVKSRHASLYNEEYSGGGDKNQDFNDAKIDEVFVDEKYQEINKNQIDDKNKLSGSQIIDDDIEKDDEVVSFNAENTIDDKQNQKGNIIDSDQKGSILDSDQKESIIDSDQKESIMDSYQKESIKDSDWEGSSERDLSQDEQAKLSDRSENEVDKGVEDSADFQIEADESMDASQEKLIESNHNEFFDSNDLFEAEKKRWGNLATSKILDEIAYDILHFFGNSFYDSLSVNERANLIFNKVVAASGKSYYQTAALLVDLPRREMSNLLEQFDIEQRDYIKKLVKSYRSRFVSMAEDIRKAEEDAQSQNLEKFANSNEPIFIKNAGMVLLNPYLMRLFKRFDLVEGKQFKDNSSKEKGVFLLQYLVNKSTDPEEFDLPLNKIICDIPLGVPIKTKIELTNEDMKICDGLLDAVVNNWGALKNTSADGLRTSFLMREGTLHREATGWKLYIEKKVYDILLDKLPWGYGMIQLPWMEIPLYTEWETK